ncbi:LysR family transcriptional regulator [Mycolicibacterium sp. 018/SC-01/001]|uniref:LysR family transcriptional regulator n=1 Tax=Mycolicibacterium sp. 018/SC-01/001 TaxID=2592069 RepID=UPI00117DA85D|nr:LysR family transcriptional regulator [Mycolicibacterium sp. 018/SC-01/001]TRW89091.1 LysR family transcriptional regulator [Mycolicibacterium sp. 018/SC-01/001]
MQLSARMPDLLSLEVLLAIARTGSLGAAGRECGLTQQAVSARIAALERQTGVRLVIRSKTGSRLTPAGAVAAQWADRLLAVAHEVDAGLATLRDDTKTRLRITASLTIAEQLLPRWLVSWRDSVSRQRANPPDVILTAANSEQVIAAIRDDRADLGFVESPGVPRPLRSTTVAHDELVVVVPPTHRWARRPPPIPAEELAATALVTREKGSGTRGFLGAALRRVTDAPQKPPALELSSAAAVRAAVLADAGPAVLSRLAVADDLELGRLRAVEVAGLDLRRALRAVWAGGSTPPAGAVRDLLSHIAAVRRHRSP